MPLIINPAQERLAKEAKDGLIMDEKNLARTLFTNSFCGDPTKSITAEQAFDEARHFVRVQTSRFPLNNTGDGRGNE